MIDIKQNAESLTAHGWTFHLYADADGWRWAVNLGTIRFGDLMLACQEGHPSQTYPSADAAKIAAIEWAVENEREDVR